MADTENNNKSIIYLGILTFVFILAYTYTFDTKIAMLGDNASYYILGKALSLGEGYVNISQASHSPNNHYPPGYPAILSVLLIFTESIFVIKVLNGIFFLGAVWVVFFMFKKFTQSHALAFILSLFILLNSHLLWYSSIMMSEIPFLFFSVLSVLSFTKCDLQRPSFKDPYLVISIISLIVAYYIRSLGVALLAGYFLYFLIEKKWKVMAIYCAAFIAAFTPWFIRSQMLGGGSYIRQLRMVNPYQPALGQADFGDFVDRFFNNFSRYITREIPSAIFPAKVPEYHTPLESGEWLMGLCILGLIIYGIYSLQKFKWLIGGYLLATFGILLIWPEVWIGVRFIVPVIPFLVLSFFYGLYTALIRVKQLTGKQNASFQPYWLLIFSFFYFNPVNVLHKQAKEPYSPGWKNYFEVAQWLKKNESPEAVVSCGKPSLFYLYSNTYTIRYKFDQDPRKLINHLEDKKVDYVVIDQVYGNTLRYLLPAVRQYPERFEPVIHLKNPDTFLLKFKRQ